MLDVAIELVHLHASNQVVCYSDALSAQIPMSHAGVAFRVFSRALLQRELASVCTFWDACGEHRNSIPTVVELVDDDLVRSLIYDRKLTVIQGGRSLSAENPEMLAWLTELSDRDAIESASKRAALISEAAEEARSVVQSSVVRAARDFRDSTLAHNLSADARQFPELSSKYGDEKRLLELSQSILEKLNLGVRNSSYDWAGTWRIAERNAAALWNGCKLNVIE